MVPRDGLLHGGHGLLAFFARRTGVGVVVQLDAGAVRELSQRVHEVQVLDLAHERDLVSRCPTAEAVVATFFGVHRERRRLLAVKGAQSGPTTTGLLQGHGLADEGHDVGRGANLRDLTLRYGHRKKVPVLLRSLHRTRNGVCLDSAPMSEFSVEATDIVRTFNNGEFRALDGVSLQVPTGQVFGLLGPNGSGKTTMVRILSTVLAPTEGRAIVGGYRRREAARARASRHWPRGPVRGGR